MDGERGEASVKASNTPWLLGAQTTFTQPEPRVVRADTSNAEAAQPAPPRQPARDVARQFQSLPRDAST
eukprot:14667027-Alexandrium_andersonii.AAC.1